MGKYKNLVDRASGSVDYWAQVAMRLFVGQIDRRMKMQNMSQALLAERLDSTPAYVTKVMRGDVNFTLETMTKLALAVGGKLQVAVVDRDANPAVRTEWHREIGRPVAAAAQTRLIELDVVQAAANRSYISERVTGAAV